MTMKLVQNLCINNDLKVRSDPDRRRCPPLQKKKRIYKSDMIFYLLLFISLSYFNAMHDFFFVFFSVCLRLFLCFCLCLSFFCRFLCMSLSLSLSPSLLVSPSLSVCSYFFSCHIPYLFLRLCIFFRSEEHTSELQSPDHLVC